MNTIPQESQLQKAASYLFEAESKRKINENFHAAIEKMEKERITPEDEKTLAFVKSRKRFIRVSNRQKIKSHRDLLKASWRFARVSMIIARRYNAGSVNGFASRSRMKSNTRHSRNVRRVHHTAKHRQFHSDSGGSNSGSDSDGGADCPPGPDCYFLSATPLPFVPIQKIKTSFDPTYHFMVPSSVLGGEAA